MLIVADTSARLSLAACDSLTLLDSLFGEVRVPPAVYAECVVPGKAGAERLERFLTGRVSDADFADLGIADRGLGRGELEAMALYRMLHADRLLVDDGRARRIARAGGIEVIGSIGVLLTAKDRGFVAAIRPCLEAIRAAGIYVAEGLAEEALRIAGESSAQDG